MSDLRKVLRLVIGAVLLVGFLSSGLVGQQKKAARYSATVVGTQGPLAGRSTFLDIYIDEFTTDEQIKEYAEILMEGGQTALRRTLEKVKVGRIAPTGSVGNDLAVARRFVTEQGELVRLFTARVMPFLELYYSGRSTDYPFGMVQFSIDKEGKGEGVIIGAASVKFNKEGQLEIESYGHQPLKIVNVKKYE